MNSAENKALVRQFFDQVFNAGDVASIERFCKPGSMLAGGIAGQIRTMRTGFPDNQFIIEEMLAEGDQVAVQVAVRGTHTGPLAGLPGFGRLEVPLQPTGQTVTTSAMYIFKLSEGKIVSFAVELDQLALLRQLGWTIEQPAAPDI